MKDLVIAWMNGMRNILLCTGGYYDTRSRETKEIEEELNTFTTDKENLRNDLANIAADMRRAINKVI